MLKIIFDEKSGPPMIAANGSLVDITHELCRAIAGIHQTLEKTDPMAALQFRHVFKEVTAMDGGPIWAQKIEGIMIGYHTPMKED